MVVRVACSLVTCQRLCCCCPFIWQASHSSAIHTQLTDHEAQSCTKREKQHCEHMSHLMTVVLPALVVTRTSNSAEGSLLSSQLAPYVLFMRIQAPLPACRTAKAAAPAHFNVLLLHNACCWWCTTCIDVLHHTLWGSSSLPAQA
jgi:hypothetical protein